MDAADQKKNDQYYQTYKILGFTGHRDVVAPEIVRKSLARLLAVLKDNKGRISVVSSAASGSDCMFLNLVEKYNFPKKLILPFPEPRFSEDFSDSEWDLAEQHIETAYDVEVVETASNDVQAYLEAGLRTLEQCDVLIAVWDGLPARGTGGTEEIITQARLLKHPLILVDAETGEISTEHFVLEAYNNNLNAEIKQTRASAKDIAKRLAEFDADSSQQAIITRSYSTIIILLHLGATAIAIFGLVYYGLPDTALIVFDAFKIIALLLAFICLYRVKRSHSHWVSHRPKTEVFRFYKSIWPLPKSQLNFRFLGEKDERRLAESLYIDWCLDKDACLSLEMAKNHYLEYRLLDQRNYFVREFSKARVFDRLASKLPISLTVAAIFFAILALSFKSLSIAGGIYYVSKLASLVLPLIVAALLSVALSLDIRRRTDRYKGIISRLDELKPFILHAPNEASLWRAVVKVESVLLLEAQEWYAVTKYAASE